MGGSTFGRIPYHIRSFNGGQSDFEDKGIAGSFKFGQSLDIRKRKDTLSCQQALKDDLAAGTMTALAYFTVAASDGFTYFFCYDGKIYSRASNGTYTLAYTDTNESGHIIGAAEWYDNAGYTYLFWATPTRLNLKKIIGPGYTNSNWSDVNTASVGSWPKTNLTSTTWHKMGQANGELLIGNNQYQALVGYDLSYTNQAVTLIPGNKVQTFVERGKYAIIGCNKVSQKDESALFAWDGLALSWNDKEGIPWAGINSMIDTEVALMQLGTQGQLYVSSLKSPLPIRAFSGGGKTNPDGVTTYHGMALFGVFGSGSNAGVWSFGRVNKNAPLALNFEYPLTCDEIGSVEVVGTDILITYKSGSNYGVKIVDTANKATAIYQSLDLVAPLGTRRYPIPLERHMQFTRATVVSSPIPTGCKIEFWYRIDKILDNSLNPNADSNGWVQANLEDTSIQAGTGIQESTFFLGDKGRVFEAQIKLIPSGNVTPEVHEFDIYFDVG